MTDTLAMVWSIAYRQVFTNVASSAGDDNSLGKTCVSERVQVISSIEYL